MCALYIYTWSDNKTVNQKEEYDVWLKDNFKTDPK